MTPLEDSISRFSARHALVALVGLALSSGCVALAEDPAPTAKSGQALEVQRAPSGAVAPTSVAGASPAIPVPVLAAPADPPLEGSGGIGDDEGPRPNPWTPPPETEEKNDGKTDGNDKNQGSDGSKSTPTK